MVACQCLVVLLGPQEIWVCRESDGSSHMELLSAACCGTADDSTATLPGEQARCEGGSCFDKPIDRTLAIRNARDVLAPCPEPGVAGSPPPVSQQGGVGRHRSEPDASARNTWREVPPTISSLTLRARLGCDCRFQRAGGPWSFLRNASLTLRSPTCATHGAGEACVTKYYRLDSAAGGVEVSSEPSTLPYSPLHKGESRTQ